MEDCLFCRIASGALGSLAYEDDRCAAFEDINPQAPVHVLIVPKEHVESLSVARREHGELLGHLLLVGAQLAQRYQIAERGYRLVLNTNAEAGQSVFHIHLHLLGGRPMRWPPG